VYKVAVTREIENRFDRAFDKIANIINQIFGFRRVDSRACLRSETAIFAHYFVYYEYKSYNVSGTKVNVGLEGSHAFVAATNRFIYTRLSVARRTCCIHGECTSACARRYVLFWRLP